MLFAYVSPGMNALNWIKEKAVDPVVEKTFEPGILEFFDKINNFFEIPWAATFVSMIQVGTLGFCAAVIVRVFGFKEVGMICLWLTVVEMFAVLARAIMG
jgi:hypothetical protein